MKMATTQNGTTPKTSTNIITAPTSAVTKLVLVALQLLENCLLPRAQGGSNRDADAVHVAGDPLL